MPPCAQKLETLPRIHTSAEEKIIFLKSVSFPQRWEPWWLTRSSKQGRGKNGASLLYWK